MAQSSNYKQYGRSVRTLTEESGFAGGMLWTGNNIDETHLKAIVNCDYDDTTGYLKARDPFTPVETSPFPDELDGLDIDLTGYRLLGAYNICAFDFEENQLDPGWLYIFSNTQSEQGITKCDMSSIVCIYNIGGNYYKCSTGVDTVVLKNITASNILLNYDNQLFGFGYQPDTGAWLHVYYVLRQHGQFAFMKRDPDTYVKKKIDAVSLLEASVTGFNAARGDDIFKYQGEHILAGEQQYIVGVYLTDAAGNIIISPTVGHSVKVNVLTTYDTSESYKHLAMFELKSNDGSTSTELESPWNFIKLEKSQAGKFTFDYTFQNKKTTLGFTYYGDDPKYSITEDGKCSVIEYVLLTEKPENWDEVSKFYYYKYLGESWRDATGEPWVAGTFYHAEKHEVAPAYTDDAVDYLMPYVVNASDNTSNLKLKSYDLKNIDGSCIWKNRMCVWGVQGHGNSLLLSEVDNFYYYPVPHNVALFDTNVVSCIPYKDSLLVFTADKIYSLSEANDGSFVQTVVQNDMPLTKADSAHLTAIKNMVLFKSGNYFYMIVPKSQSLTGELSVAPIYKNIAGFLNTLDKSIQEMLQLMYPEYLFNNCTASSTPVAVYSEQDTIHILYDVTAGVSFKDTLGTRSSSVRYYKLFLNYNTNLRAWTIYVEDTTTSSLEVAALTKERAMSFVRVYHKQLKADETDTIITRSYFDVVTQHEALETETPSTFRLLLDTGYRTLSSATQKRFREVQLKLYNEAESITSFGTSFLVDGVWRRNYSKFEETILDNNTVSLMPTLDLNTFVTELTMPVQETGQIEKNPGSDAIELNSWTLDFSHFKREAPTTVRIPVSGKGYNPRFIMLVPDAIGLTINEINWVYRLMNGR